MSENELRGSSASEHKRSKAKEASKAKQLAKEAKTFTKKVYTQNGDKVVEVTLSPKGAFSNYVGNVKKKKETTWLNQKKAEWKKEGLWIGADDFDEKSAEIVKSLQSAQEKGN